MIYMIHDRRQNGDTLVKVRLQDFFLITMFSKTSDSLV